MVKFEAPEVPFRWMTMALNSSNQIHVRNIWVDVETLGFIEPQTYATKGL